LALPKPTITYFVLTYGNKDLNDDLYASNNKSALKLKINTSFWKAARVNYLKSKESVKNNVLKNWINP
jgi:hypothetical protein